MISAYVGSEKLSEHKSNISNINLQKLTIKTKSFNHN